MKRIRVKSTKRKKTSMPRKRKTRYSRARSTYGRASRSYSRRSNSIRSKFSGGVIGDTVKARGLGQIFKDITMKFAPQYSQFAELGGQYLGGGVKGLAGAQVEMVATGQPNFIQNGLGSISGIFGGQSKSGGLAV